jgi:multidrug efflux system membrane fusion protein
MYHRNVASVLVLTLCAVGCSETKPQPAMISPPVVRVTQPIERPDVVEYEYFTGRTEAIEAVAVRARVSGYLCSIDFTSGQQVQKDQRLFQIDPRPYQAEFDKAKSQVALAEARMKLAVATYNRDRAIARTPGAISQQELDRSAAAEAEASAAVDAAKAAVDAAKLNLQFTNVLSPVDGIVGRNLLSIGNLVIQNETVLTTVVSEDPMYVYFDVNERTMLRIQDLIREGKVPSARRGEKYPVEYGLATEGDSYPHEGAIDFVNNQLDPSTGTIQVRGVFPNPKPPHDGPRLLTPGLFLRVRIPVGPPHKEMLLPESAIVTDQGMKSVFVVNDDNVVEYRPITVGPQQAGGLQVVQPVKIVREAIGLRPAREGESGEDSLTLTDRVIVAGLQRARQGVTVDPQPWKPEDQR